MTHVSSPVLETDGVEAETVECSKNQDGTLYCSVYGDDGSISGTKSGTNFDSVKTHGTEAYATHNGPQDNPHLSIGFDEPTVCRDEAGELVCRRKR